MQKFYFTYGTSENMDFYGGWTMIAAPDMSTAIALFRAVHPDRNEGILNCASYYTQEQFEKTEMYKDNDNYGYGCNEVIAVRRSSCAKENVNEN